MASFSPLSLAVAVITKLLLVVINALVERPGLAELRGLSAVNKKQTKYVTKVTKKKEVTQRLVILVYS